MSIRITRERANAMQGELADSLATLLDSMAQDDRKFGRVERAITYEQTAITYRQRAAVHRGFADAVPGKDRLLFNTRQSNGRKTRTESR